MLFLSVKLKKPCGKSTVVQVLRQSLPRLDERLRRGSWGPSLKGWRKVLAALGFLCVL